MFTNVLDMPTSFSSVSSNVGRLVASTIETITNYTAIHHLIFNFTRKFAGIEVVDNATIPSDFSKIKHLLGIGASTINVLSCIK